MCSKLFGGDGSGGSEWPTEVDFLSMWPTQTWMERRQPPQSTAQSRPSAGCFSQKTLQKCWKMKPQWIWCRVKFQMNGLRCLQINIDQPMVFWLNLLEMSFSAPICGSWAPWARLPRLALWEFAPWLRPLDFEWPSEVVEVGITWPLGIIPNLWPL